MDELLVNKAILDECLEQLRPSPPAYWMFWFCLF